VDYTSKLEFLYDRVRQQRIVSWKDAQTRGKALLFALSDMVPLFCSRYGAY
jgi:hypothetical protein